LKKAGNLAIKDKNQIVEAGTGELQQKAFKRIEV
jgi:hypothetical protein